MDRYDALRHAISAHNTDLDWCGKLYIFHPMAVADRIQRAWEQQPIGTYLSGSVKIEDAVVVALLHDVWEDTDYGWVHWAREDFTAAQWDALDRVTRWETETYREYIEKVAESPLATIVKLADLSHNMSDERKANLSEEQLKKAAGLQEKRYIPSRDRLWEALGTEWWPA